MQSSPGTSFSSAAAAVLLALTLGACSNGQSGASASSTPPAASPSASSPSASSATPSPSVSSRESTPPPAGPAPIAGGLPPDFPYALLPVMTGAGEQTGTLVRTGSMVQIGFTATIAQSPARVHQFYGAHLKKLGFKGSEGEDVSGVKTATYLRNDGDENVIVSTVPNGTSTTVTIGAAVKASTIK